MWNSFSNWLVTRNTHFALLLRLSEVSELFDRQAYNALFDRELTGVIQRATPEQFKELEKLKGFDWIGYIDRSLRNAGFQPHDLDELTHDVVVRLLVKPGQLFRGWQGQPIDRRFKASVRNAVLNLVEKRKNQRRLLPTVRLGTEITSGASMPTHLLIDEFREHLRKQLGSFAVVVFDWRLENKDTKELVGRADLGNPTAYKVKKTVQAIKAAARQFAKGDPDFMRKVETAMEEEEKTVGKRLLRQKEKAAFHSKATK